MEDLQGLYDKYLTFTDQMVGDYNAMAVAGVMLAQSLSIYKTALSANEFDKMVDNISRMRDQVKTFKPETMQ
jgi:hypothetical protein